ncbi:zinc finger MYM-type protein 1-like [Prunus persica]|uniref:zinc finger MYM-type protein 1-like n=1 Tax=Prunus persica TaxID=3760 RepID=UPI0009AB1EF4|nr:zinc finger MYM-type protein 1-like [Prunus persica]
MERFFKRKSSLVNLNNVGSSRTSSSRQSELDEVLANLQAYLELRIHMIDLSFRGNDESVTSSNRGNYLELLQFLVDNDEKVKEFVLENTPGNLKLVVPKIQKDLVNACAFETLDVIMSDLKDRFFSILVDEALNVSVKEKMAMVLHYVDNKGHVIERFVGVQHVIDTTSSSLKDAIDTFFSSNGLRLFKLRGRGYE